MLRSTSHRDNTRCPVDRLIRIFGTSSRGIADSLLAQVGWPSRVYPAGVLALSRFQRGGWAFVSWFALTRRQGLERREGRGDRGRRRQPPVRSVGESGYRPKALNQHQHDLAGKRAIAARSRHETDGDRVHGTAPRVRSLVGNTRRATLRGLARGPVLGPRPNLIVISMIPRYIKKNGRLCSFAPAQPNSWNRLESLGSRRPRPPARALRSSLGTVVPPVGRGLRDSRIANEARP